MPDPLLHLPCPRSAGAQRTRSPRAVRLVQAGRVGALLLGLCLALSMPALPALADAHEGPGRRGEQSEPGRQGEHSKHGEHNKQGALGERDRPGAHGDATTSRDERIEALEEQVRVLADELGRLRTEVAVPEEPQLKSAYGLGPAASKVYGVGRGVSLGGYGEVNYTAKDAGEDDRADALRGVIYLGYKFNERVLFNSEIEFEHGTTGNVSNDAGGGSASIELAAIDMFFTDQFNFRAGLLLTPMGFINEVHEPPFYYGVARPESEKKIIPSTWRNPGIGIFGALGESFDYRVYLMTGQNGSRFSDSGIRGSRQKGNRALANDLALVLRGDFRPQALPGLLVGGALYSGEMDQDRETNGIDLSGIDARLTMGEAHLEYRRGPFHARALFVRSKLSKAEEVNAAFGKTTLADVAANEMNPVDGFSTSYAIAEEMQGAYIEFAYDILPGLSGNREHALEPFLRFEQVDTQAKVPSGYVRNAAREYRVFTAGVHYYPHPNVSFKAEYRDLDPEEGELPNEISLGVGFAF